MKRVILAGVSALAVVTMMSAANAADLPRRHAAMPVKAPEYMAAYNWTGAYIGINGGGAWGRSSWSGTGFNTSGGMVGGTVGFSWQTGPAAFGLEGDIDWSGQRGSGSCGVTTCNVRNDYLATIRGRLGYAMDRWMPYVTGGAAIGNVKTSIAGFGDTNNTQAGWTLGGGIEASLMGPRTAKVDYLHVVLGDADSGRPGTSKKFTSDIIRGGINYYF